MILVTGTGQSGTTAFLLLLEALGLDTGKKHEFLRDEKMWKEIEQGKIPKWPSVIKHLGGFCYNLNSHVDRWNWKVDHIFIVLRNLDQLARKKATKPEKFFRAKALKISNEKLRNLSEDNKKEIIKDNAKDQIGALIFNILDRDYPFSLVEYPKYTENLDYCYKKISPIIPCTWDTFLQAHNKAIDKSKVNRY